MRITIKRRRYPIVRTDKSHILMKFFKELADLGSLELFIIIRVPFLFLNFTANHSALFHLALFAKLGRNSLPLYITTLSLSYKRYFFIIIIFASFPALHLEKRPSSPSSNPWVRATEGRPPEFMLHISSADLKANS